MLADVQLRAAGDTAGGGMGLSVIRVSFSRQANDGDYGSETARCELEYTVGPEDDEISRTKELPALLLIDAREFVHQELAKSPNWKVRRAVAEPDANDVQTVEGENGNELEDLPL
jgi:hypothetical protein